MVSIVETGISLMELDCHSLEAIENRIAQTVDLRRRNGATSAVGIYRCDIPTIAVHDDDDDNSVRETVYVGLYYGSGGKFYILEEH